MLATLRHRDYRLLWLGQGVSVLGDQFHLVALPWLVLQITHDPLQLGLVMGTAGIPRAAFMLVGGAWADRYSPRLIMLVSDVVRFVTTALVAGAAITGVIQLWHIYVLAVVFGTVSGFFTPAAQASVPRLLPDGELERGNALMRTVESAASFVGPAAAGLLVAAFGSQVVAGERVASLAGIGFAQAIDSASFLFSAGCLALMRSLPAPEEAPETHPVTDIIEGLRFAWSSASIRLLLLLVAAANLALTGPLMVGIPVLADERLGGATAFGLIMSGLAGGKLAGMVTAGTIGRLPGNRLRAVVVSVYALFAAAMAWLAFVTSTWQALPLLVVVGAVDGYVGIFIMSQLQRMTPRAFLGRMMALISLAIFGLMPLSMAVSGMVSRVNVAALFLGSAIFMIAIGVVAAFRPEVDAWALTTPAEEIAS